MGYDKSPLFGGLYMVPYGCFYELGIRFAGVLEILFESIFEPLIFDQSSIFII